MKRIIPHLTIVLALMTLIFFVIDIFNEYMAFMTSDLSKAVFAALAVCSIITSVCLIVEVFREDARRERRRRRMEKKKREQDEANAPMGTDS